MKYHLMFLYLTYVNDWLTIAAMSKAYGLTITELKHMLDAGKRFQEENAERFRITGINYYAEYADRNDIEAYRRFI